MVRRWMSRESELFYDNLKHKQDYVFFYEIIVLLSFFALDRYKSFLFKPFR